jgi:hypothetical protein
MTIRWASDPTDRLTVHSVHRAATFGLVVTHCGKELVYTPTVKLRDYHRPCAACFARRDQEEVR